MDQQLTFAEHATSAQKAFDLAAEHEARLDALFASLQQRAFSGELTGAGAARELAEVG